MRSCQQSRSAGRNLRSGATFLIGVFLAVLLVLLLPAVVSAQDFVTAQEVDVITSKAKVLSISTIVKEETNEFEIDDVYSREIELVEVKVTSGKYRGQTLVIRREASDESLGKEMEVGDKIVIAIVEEAGYFQSAHITDFQRDWLIYLLLGVFVLVLLEVGQVSGVKMLISLIISLLLIAKVLLPSALRGYDPIFLSFAIALFTILITMLLKNDSPEKTWPVVIGSSAGILLAAVLAFVATKLIHLTGLSQEDIGVLWVLTEGKLNVSSLLVAGVIIGSIGAVLHAAVSITHAVEVALALDPFLSVKDLYREGVRVGRDIASTMSSALIFGLIGLALPLLVHFQASGEHFIEIINMDVVAGLLVKVLAACVGLMAAIPATAISAAYFKKKVAKADLIDLT
ncbi:MAG TPA: YibE/F family protein [Bacillota bacterium]|nr:YibE/F family protein [Bacillota bacterium]